MKTVAILQSNYIPWKGYFDIISRVDEFILYDTAQYTRRTWRNRNLIQTPNGLQWLVIPVHHDRANPKRICDTVVVDDHWRNNHWKNLVQHYSHAPFFKYYADCFKSLYIDHTDQLLSEINYRFIRSINEILGISTKVTLNTSYVLTGDKDKDLITLCKKAGANRYLSGPVAKTFLNETVFATEGITLEWMNYDRYTVYPQLYEPFTHGVSVLDLIFNTGNNAKFYIQNGKNNDK